MRKLGRLQSWNKERGFGVVRIGPAGSLERYFLHANNIKSGTSEPIVGQEIEFEISTKPVMEGWLPLAVRADVIMPTTDKAAALLAGKESEVTEAK